MKGVDSCCLLPRAARARFACVNCCEVRPRGALQQLCRPSSSSPARTAITRPRCAGQIKDVGGSHDRGCCRNRYRPGGILLLRRRAASCGCHQSTLRLHLPLHHMQTVDGSTFSPKPHASSRRPDDDLERWRRAGTDIAVNLEAGHKAALCK